MINDLVFSHVRNFGWLSAVQPVQWSDFPHGCCQRSVSNFSLEIKYKTELPAKQTDQTVSIFHLWLHIFPFIADIAEVNTAFLSFYQHCWQRGCLVWNHFIGTVNGQNWAGVLSLCSVWAPVCGRSMDSSSVKLQVVALQKGWLKCVVWVNATYKINKHAQCLPCLNKQGHLCCQWSNPQLVRHLGSE